jgi:predicted MPP superfamily phosphohydrolase
MNMQVLAFSDLHGSSATLKLLREAVKDESYDYILVAGDLTNADLLRPSERVKQVKEIFSIMESLKIPYYYVWGVPFRESCLTLAQENYTVEEQEEEVILTRKSDSWTQTVKMGRKGWQLFREVDDFLFSLSFGKHLKEDEPVKLGRYWLTSSPERVPTNAILLKHHYRKIIPKALIQLDGHLHFGQKVKNYLNLGFLYRDAAHRASPMMGCYWKLNLEGSTVSASFKNLSSKMKEYRCPDHPEEGTFYIPFFWKNCPICYEPRQAIATRSSQLESFGDE